MEISKIRNAVDLTIYYLQKDKDRNGKLDSSEVTSSAINANDRNGDKVLLPWEIMESINIAHKAKIFSDDRIKYIKKENEEGKSYNHIELSEDAVINNIHFSSGSSMIFHDNGNISYADISANTVINGVNYKGGVVESVNFHENGNVYIAKLASDAVINGVKYAADTEIVFHENGKVKHGVLKDSIQIQGINYKAGNPIQLFENGEISSGVLLNETLIEGTSFPAGTTIEYSGGKISSADLFADTYIQGIKFKAGTRAWFDWWKGKVRNGYLAQDTVLDTIEGKICFQGGTHISFHDELVNSGVLAEDTEIMNILFKKGTEVIFSSSGGLILKLSNDTNFNGIIIPEGSTSVYVNEKGQLWHAELPIDTVFNGVKYAKWSEVSFYKNGQVHTGKIAQSEIIQSMNFGPETRISFDEKGKLKSVKIYEDMIIQGIEFGPGDSISFREDGNLSSIQLSYTANTVIQHINFRGSTYIDFYENGKIKTAFLKKDAIIQGVKFKAGKMVVKFFKNGQVKNGILAEDAVIQGTSLLAGRWVEFNKNGQLLLPARFTSIVNGVITKAETFTFNGGKIKKKADGSLIFSAKKAEDPGFGIFTNNYDLSGANTLSFEIKGNLGFYANLVVQIYDDKAVSDLIPTVQQYIYDVSKTYSTITIDLERKIDKARKIQFILTDGSSCWIRIRNIRFESGQPNIE